MPRRAGSPAHRPPRARSTTSRSRPAGCAPRRAPRARRPRCSRWSTRCRRSGARRWCRRTPRAAGGARSRCGRARRCLAGAASWGFPTRSASPRSSPRALVADPGRRGNGRDRVVVYPDPEGGSPPLPWCRKLCPYCDFAVEVGPPAHEAYLTRSRELELADRVHRRAGLDLPRRRYAIAAAARLHRGGDRADPRPVRRAARDHDRGQPDRLHRRQPGCVAAGIGRISIGVQSF